MERGLVGSEMGMRDRLQAAEGRQETGGGHGGGGGCQGRPGGGGGVAAEGGGEERGGEREREVHRSGSRSDAPGCRGHTSNAGRARTLRGLSSVAHRPLRLPGRGMGESAGGRE